MTETAAAGGQQIHKRRGDHAPSGFGVGTAGLMRSDCVN